MTDHYILDENHKPLLVSVEVWARWTDDINNRRVAWDVIYRVRVSTVFLGLDHNFGDDGPPILFETMCFEPSDNEMRDIWASRCTTWEEALVEHSQAVQWASPFIHPLLGVTCWHAPYYQGSDQHVFVLLHKNESSWWSRKGQWSTARLEAQIFTHDQLVASSINDDGNGMWVAVGVRISLEGEHDDIRDGELPELPQPDVNGGALPAPRPQAGDE